METLEPERGRAMGENGAGGEHARAGEPPSAEPRPAATTTPANIVRQPTRDRMARS